MDPATWNEVGLRRKVRETWSVAVRHWDPWDEVGGRMVMVSRDHRLARRDAACLVRLDEVVHSSCQGVGLGVPDHERLVVGGA